MKILLSILVTISLLLWGAVWWVTGEHDLDSTVSSTVAASPEFPAPRLKASQAPPPQTFSQPVPSPKPTTGAMPTEGAEPFKPLTEPAEDPLPPPVKPNSQGVIDLSSDPTTKTFTEFLERGYARRLQLETGRVPQPSAPPQ